MEKTFLEAQLEKLEHDMKTKLAAMPPVDINTLQQQYRTEHAAEIASNEKHMSSMRAICRVFEKSGAESCGFDE